MEVPKIVAALISVITMFSVAAFFLTVALLLLGEVFKALRWAVAEMATFSESSSGRGTLEGVASVLAGALWLSASAAAVAWITTVLLAGHGESVMWGNLALNVLIVLWWIATMRLREIRQAVRQGRRVPAIHPARSERA